MSGHGPMISFDGSDPKAWESEDGDTWVVIGRWVTEDEMRVSVNAWLRENGGDGYDASLDVWHGHCTEDQLRSEAWEGTWLVWHGKPSDVSEPVTIAGEGLARWVSTLGDEPDLWVECPGDPEGRTDHDAPHGVPAKELTGDLCDECLYDLRRVDEQRQR